MSLFAEQINILKENYRINFDNLEMLRDAGSTSYAAFAGGKRYFLRIIKPAFLDTAVMGADIQAYLQKQGFPVLPVIFTKNNFPYAKTDRGLFILYEFIEGSEPNQEIDAETIGALIGKLHHMMKGYSGKLIKRDKHFYIARYIEILKRKQYPKSDDFSAYSNALWEKVKKLPRGYCHGDMYAGNIHKTPDGIFYVLDFDSSCEGFPMYDPTLICNQTNYFDFDENGYEKSKRILSRFLPEYLKHNAFNQKETDAFYDLIALYHFALQATIIELYGIDRVDNAFFDKQLDWLYKWREQCERNRDEIK